jgi:hypothetical protein
VWSLWNLLASLTPWGSWKRTAATSSEGDGSEGRVSFLFRKAVSLSKYVIGVRALCKYVGFGVGEVMGMSGAGCGG